MQNAPTRDALSWVCALKENFKNDLERNDWKLVIQLKKMLDI